MRIILNIFLIVNFLLIGAVQASNQLKTSKRRTASSERPFPAPVNMCTQSLLSLGSDGNVFKSFPFNPPPAKDSVTFRFDNLLEKNIVSIKVADSAEYQQADEGETLLKTRAEFTMPKPASQYRPGDDRVYRIIFRLDPSWVNDDNEAILTQFKRAGKGPDAFVGIKGDRLVLRVGTAGTPYASQNTVVKGILKGTWLEVLVFVHWSLSKDGLIQITYRYSGENFSPNTISVSGQNLIDGAPETYVKFGIYKPQNFPPTPASASLRTQIVDFESFDIWSK